MISKGEGKNYQIITVEVKLHFEHKNIANYTNMEQNEALVIKQKPSKIPGGALGYFLGGYVPPGTPNWHPVLEKISPKIDTPF